jgi:hypothetical protein
MGLATSWEATLGGPACKSGGPFYRHPDVEEVITEPSSNPFSLWLELYFVLVDCYQRNPPNDDLIGRIYDFGV